jgi:transposase, IS5 family
LEARWAPKNGVNHYGYNNNICIDVEHGFMRGYAMTPANINDNQMMPMLLGPENTDDYV